MKKITLPFVALLPLLLQAQNKDVSGTYYGNEAGKLIITPNNTFELVAFSGKYSQDKDGKLNFTIEQQGAFNVKEIEKGDTDQITVVLKTNYLRYVDLRYIYIGYKDKDNSIKYLNTNVLFNEQNKDEELESTFYKDEYVFKIPKTSALHLVNAFSDYDDFRFAQKKVFIEEYNLSDNVKTLEVSVNGTALVYTALDLKAKVIDEGTLKLSFGRGTDSYTFLKEDMATNEAGYLKSTTIKTVENWEHLIPLKDNYFDYEEIDENAKIEVKRTLDEALKQSKKDNIALVVFYQPIDTDEQKAEFEFFIKNLEKENTFLYYNNSKVNLYFTDKKDDKWIKKNKIKTKNQILVLDNDGMVIYHEENTPSDINNSFHYTNTLQMFNGMYQMQTLDKVFQNKKATIAQYQEAFKTLFNKIETSYLNYLQYKQETQGVELAEAPYMYYDYIEDYIKNQDAVYKLKTSKEQVNTIWKKIIDSHKNDSKFDPAYINLLYLNYFSYKGDYHSKLFGLQKRYDQSDLDALSYIIKFFPNINQYEKDKSIEIEPDEDYDIFSVYNLYDFDNRLDKIAEDNPNLLKQVDALYLQGYQQNIIRYDDYDYFLEKHFPEKRLDNFSEYFDSIVTNNEHIIVSLDRKFSSIKDAEFSSLSDWSYYKLSFANKANNIAWEVVENFKNDASKINKALKWSATSVELEPENPYYLDTYAHLLYFSGNKNKAIEVQRKAVKALQDNRNDFDQGNEENIIEALDKMIKGTL